MTEAEVVPHGLQGGRVGGGRSFSVVGVAEVVAAAAETVAGFLHLGSSHQDAALSNTLLMVPRVHPTACRETEEKWPNRSSSVRR